MRLFWLVLLPACAYQFLAIIAALLHLQRRRKSAPSPSFTPGISVLKPLRGLDPNTYEAFISQVQQEYPKFEVLFGAREPDDLAAAQVRRLQQQFPEKDIRLIVGSGPGANGKIGVLIELARHARYSVWVINDSDIHVTSSYLSEIVRPLADPSVGVVTCLYRVYTHTLPAAWEGLGITTDFMPSTLVAQLLGVREFGLGSTLVFRAADLERVGGFETVADYLADDYQLAKKLTALGKHALLSTYTVETALGDATWRGVWNHQLRWARTIRLTKRAASMGLPITHAGLWCLIALACGAWVPAAVLIALRISSAFITGRFVLNDAVATKFSWLAPVWDLYAFSVWLASYAGRRVRWRDRVFNIGPDGRIQN